jgi:hypothetical protein
MWALHTLNIGIVYLMLKRFTESWAGAGTGTVGRDTLLRIDAAVLRRQRPEECLTGCTTANGR